MKPAKLQVKRQRKVVVWLAFALAFAGVAVARADEPRPLHWGVGVGGFGALTGPASWGPGGEVELYPGGRWGRYGVRAGYLGMAEYDDLTRLALFGGLTFEAAAARPTLQLALHVDAGWDLSADRVVIGGGLQTQLWILGPLAVGLDTVLFVFASTDDASLMLGSLLTLRLAR